MIGMLVVVGLLFGFTLGASMIGAIEKGSRKPMIAAVFIALISILVLASIRIVPAGHVGVVDLFGNVGPRALASGINLINPLARVVPISVRTQEEKETMNVPSKEGLNISLDVSVLYKLNPEMVVDIYKTVGFEYRDVVLSPQFRAAARGVTVGHEAKALYTSEREMLAQSIADSLRSLTEDRGIIIEQVLLRAITLPTTVSGAIEQKLKAEQEAERMKFILDREKLEAERKRVEAAGIRDAQEIINQSLTAQYLDYLWISTLNLNPNVIYVATEANMPLFRAINPDEQLRNRRTVAPAQ